MDASNGRILWSTANPSNRTANGPVSVANGVVFAGSADRMGSVYAIDAMNGKIFTGYLLSFTFYRLNVFMDGAIFHSIHC